MVNILIYSEPIVFLEQVEKNSGLLGHLNHQLINPLKNFLNHKYKIYVICNEFQLLDEHIEHGVELIRVTQKELTGNWKYKPFEILEQWQTGLYSDETLNYYCQLFNEKILFKPDIIFTIFKAPFLEKLFKDTLMLGCSVGILSRAPYPHTSSYVVGDLGRALDCYTSEYWKLIKPHHQLTENHKKLIEKFKTKAKSVIDKKNPYKELLNEYRAKFKYLYLLPLTTPFDLYFARQKTYCSQLHLLLDVLDNTPSNVGIIVTTHPRLLDYLDKEMISALKKRYNHFLYDQSFVKYLSVSQFLLPEIDGVISMVTSVALQAMIFDKKIITLGETFLDCVRDASSLEEFAKTLDKPATNKDDLLFWYLTRYCPTSKYYLDSEWLDAYLMRSLEKFRNKDFANFYELIDEPSVIFNHLMESFDENIPYRPKNISENIKELIINKQNNIPIEYNRDYYFNKYSLDNIYLGEGFSSPEPDHIWTNQNLAEIEFPIQLPKTDIRLTIKGNALTELQVIEIMVNDIVYGKIDNNGYNYIIKIDELKGKKYLNIKLIVSKIYSPKELGINDDPRKLGFSLISIGLYEYN
jgi:hypothetical protein